MSVKVNKNQIDAIGFNSLRLMTAFSDLVGQTDEKVQ